ncbi:methionyl-tRNA formyltransferase [Natrononativus amylolyticus]|uniref:methionyl-tRNA formyltransferase n=1 Tax=Natrononativus amylolyticus TaxID=2963434 RepID=UPI0020CFE78C|nr:methionyl-tRNA formyltransferase [Natrononativus amylolyticus]
MTDANQHSVVYVGCTAPARDVLETLLERDVPITGVVTIGPEMARANAVSGYASLAPVADEHGLPVYRPESYSMTGEADLERFQAFDPDLLVVNGWQRLVPEAILETATYGALGNHGSAFGLPEGRGRSPLNWSLIEDRDRFLLSVIALDPGADSGDVVTTRKFDITEYDTIETLYYKVTMLLKEMLLEVIEPILAEEQRREPQRGDPTYYPKRTPEDGAIHWGDGTDRVYNLVRAVADPYPGAFTFYEDERVMIWEAIPFSSDIAPTADPGTVVDVFWTGEFVVATADGTVLVREWEADRFTPEAGQVLESTGENGRIDGTEQRHNLSSTPTDGAESEPEVEADA